MKAELPNASSWHSDSALHYVDGELYCESVPLAKIAELLGTPTYVYSSSALLARVQAYKDATRHLGEKCLISGHVYPL